MKIACLSGKGGAGKTFVAVNLANVAGKCTYIDCDVEEPNGYLFLKTTNETEHMVNTKVPTFDAQKCMGCKQCVTFCRFNALAYIKDKPMLFTDVCHHCGGCQLVCEYQAISEIDKTIGIVKVGKHQDIKVVTGILNPKEASGIPVIQSALKHASELTILDGPPGSACPVIEIVSEADYCILVVEPTSFGFHNMKMVHELTQLMNKPCGVIVNKEVEPYEPLEAYCHTHHLLILDRIAYDEQVAQNTAMGTLITDLNSMEWNRFKNILKQVGVNHE
ncbi:MAG: 4Fe-4S binding protein [Erysipelotrichaceae bacterium]